MPQFDLNISKAKMLILIHTVPELCYRLNALFLQCLVAGLNFSFREASRSKKIEKTFICFWHLDMVSLLGTQKATLKQTCKKEMYKNVA
mmetsp:Transcript_23567/g.41852  ORF Transcript_23567/g.41852 Transcript_23567/m.41852 type:complete len:89 (-) Transcript_23567:2-268(-)